MSGTTGFGVLELNPQSHENQQPDSQKAATEHATIGQLLAQRGVDVQYASLPNTDGLQDAVYTANWALIRGDKAVMSRLPNKRKNEEALAEQTLQKLGKTIIKAPEDLRFSGQGDALPCGNFLFAGSHYRTDRDTHAFLAKTLGYEVISLQTIPLTDTAGQSIVNHVTGWPDSFFYDIDLALAILKAPTDQQKGLIAWCPDAFLPESRQKLAQFDAVDKIEVSLEEARDGFACNLVSTGSTVIMSDKAPKLQEKLKQLGFQVHTPQITELAKGGGYIRCTTLTLN